MLTGWNVDTLSPIQHCKDRTQWRCARPDDYGEAADEPRSEICLTLYGYLDNRGLGYTFVISQKACHDQEVAIFREGARRVVVPANAVWDDFFDRPGIEIEDRVQLPHQQRESF